MAIILLPGFMTDASLWDDMVPLLEPLAPIVFGDVFQDGSIEGMAQRVLAQAPPDFVLLGFSMGGYVAREIARMAPQRVQALVLAGTSARGDRPDQIKRKGAAAERVAATSFTGLSRRAVASALHPSRAGDAALVERILAMGQRLGGEVFLRQSTMRRGGDLDRLAEIRCRTLVIAAAEDGLRSLAEAEELQMGIAGARLQVIEGSGHMMPLEVPDVLAQAVLSWLAAD